MMQITSPIVVEKRMEYGWQTVYVAIAVVFANDMYITVEGKGETPGDALANFYSRLDLL